MKLKAMIPFAFAIFAFFMPMAFAYNYVFSWQSPMGSTIPTTTPTYALTLKYTVMLNVTTFEWLNLLFTGKTTNLQYQIQQDLNPSYTVSWGSVWLPKMAQYNDFMIYIAVAGSNYTWRPCVQDDVGVYCDINFYNFYVRQTGAVIPPTATNARSCYPYSSCFPSGTTLPYNAPYVIPRINITTNTGFLKVCIYANSTIRGAFYSQCETPSLSGPNIDYSGNAITLIPGDTVRWRANISDGLTVPPLTTAIQVINTNAAADNPPIINLTTPSNGFQYASGTTQVTAYAIITDADSPTNTVTFSIHKQGELYDNICVFSAASVPDLFQCTFNTGQSGITYYWRVTAVDSVPQNLRTAERTFVVGAPSIDNEIPKIDVVTISPSSIVSLNQSVIFTWNATDHEQDPIYYDIYCQYKPNGISDASYDGNANASWSGGFTTSYPSPATFTFTCPDTTKNTPQWELPGKYMARFCVTDAVHGFGSSAYNLGCQATREITVLNTTSFGIIYNVNESIFLNSCMVGEGCILNEFYLGMVLFISQFLIYFFYILIAGIMFLAAYYTYLRVKEGLG